MLANPNSWFGQQRGGTLNVSSTEQTSLPSSQRAMQHPWKQAAGPYGLNDSIANVALTESSLEQQQQQQQQQASGTATTPFAYHPSPSFSAQQQHQYDQHARQSSVSSGYQHDVHRPSSAGHFGGVSSSSARYPSGSPYAEPAYPSSASTMSSASPLYGTHHGAGAPSLSSPAGYEMGGPTMMAYGPVGVPNVNTFAGGHYIVGPSAHNAPADQYPFGQSSLSSANTFHNHSPYDQQGVVGGGAGAIGLHTGSGYPFAHTDSTTGDRNVQSSYPYTGYYGGGTSTPSSSMGAIGMTVQAGGMPGHHGYHPYGGGGVVTGMATGYRGGTAGSTGNAPAPPASSSSSSSAAAGAPSYQMYNAEGRYDQRMSSAFFNPFEVKHRRRTTRSQFKLLESTFQQTPKPSAATRKAISKQLDMPLRAVQIWFQNRRAKAKVQAKRDGGTGEGSSRGRSSTGGNAGRSAGDELASEESADDDVATYSQHDDVQHMRKNSQFSSTSSYVTGSIEDLSSSVEQQPVSPYKMSGLPATSMHYAEPHSQVQHFKSQPGTSSSTASFDVFKVPSGRYRSSDAGDFGQASAPQHPDNSASDNVRYPTDTNSNVRAPSSAKLSPFPLAHPTAMPTKASLSSTNPSLKPAMASSQPSTAFSSHSSSQSADQTSIQGVDEQQEQPFWPR